MRFFRSFRFFSFSRMRAHNGFTLLELMIVISIFTIMTGVLLANYRRFGSNVALTNLANDIAISIRETQAYALGVKGITVSNQINFSKPYGIFFDSYTGSLGQKNYIQFADDNDNETYQAGDIEVKSYSFANNRVFDSFGIQRKCRQNSNNSWTNISNDKLNIIFKRPNPNAYIRSTGSPTYKAAELCIATPNTDLSGDNVRRVVVYESGQVEVKTSGPCSCQ